MKTRTFLLSVAGLLLAIGSCFAAGALSVDREVTIDTSPATVWKLVGNFNAIDIWHPAVLKSELQGQAGRAGARRLLTLEDGATRIEKLLSYSAAQRSYSYSILESGLPVANYKATLTLAPAEEGRTLMIWRATFDANGVSDEQATAIIGSLHDAGMAKVRANFRQP